MAILVICTKTKCMYAKERRDGAYQCSATTIGINLRSECDTYTVLQPLNKVVEDGQAKRRGVCKKCGKTGSNYGCKACYKEAPAT